MAIRQLDGQDEADEDAMVVPSYNPSSNFNNDHGGGNDEIAYARAMRTLAQSADVDSRQEARKTLLQLSRSGHAPSLMWTATSAWKKGDRSSAITAARKALEAAPNPETYRLLGDWLWETSLMLPGATASILKTRTRTDDDEDEDEQDSTPQQLQDMLQDLVDAVGCDVEGDAITLATVASACAETAMTYWSECAGSFDDVPCMLRLANACASPQMSDVDGARGWWERAAALGDESAVFSLAHLALAEAAGAEGGGIQTLHKNKKVTNDDQVAPEVDDDVPDANDCVDGADQDGGEHETGPFRYVQLAAKRGDGACCRALGDISAGFWTPEPVKTTSVKGKRKKASKPRRARRMDAAAALEWYIAGAASGDDASLLRAAHVLYEGGSGVERDAGRAVTLLEQAARKIQQPSLGDVAQLARSGDHDAGLRPDAKRAFELYVESVRSEKSAASMCALADMLWAGEGCEKDRRRAYGLYRRAAKICDGSDDEGDPIDGEDGACGAALLGMVRSLWTGDGVRKNKVRARKLMRQLLRTGDPSADQMAIGEIDAAIDNALLGV